MQFLIAASSPGRSATAPSSLVGDAALRRRRRSARRSMLPIDAVPDVTNVQVQVITAAPALSPVEVEQYVTVPVERAMAGIPKVEEVRSISKYGLSVVTVVFDDDTDIYFARQMVLERMREAEDAVSRALRAPGDGADQHGARRGLPVRRARRGALADGAGGDARLVHRPAAPHRARHRRGQQLRRRGQAVSGRRSIRSASRPRGLSVEEVVRALERTNANAGGGYIEHNREQLVIGTDGLVTSLDDLKTVVVGATPQGVPITVANVGDVRFGAAAAPRRRVDGRPGRGGGRRRAHAHRRERAHRDRAREGEARGAAADAPPGHPHRALLRPRRAGRPDDRDRRRRTWPRARCWSSSSCSCCSGTCAPGLIVAATIPLSMLFAITADERCTGARAT